MGIFKEYVDMLKREKDGVIFGGIFGILAPAIIKAGGRDITLIFSPNSGVGWLLPAEPITISLLNLTIFSIVMGIHLGVFIDSLIPPERRIFR